VTDWHTGQFGYNYDEANRLTGVTLPISVTSSYAYDEAGRLTLLTHSTLTGTLASYAYDLDQVGNRRVLTEALTTILSLPSGAYLENGGQVVMEAENGDITNGTTHNWLRLTYQTGFTGTSYIQTSPDLDALYQPSDIISSPVVAYPINVTTPGTYTLWLRGYPANAAGDSAYVGLDEQTVEVTGFTPGEWGWASTTTAGVTATLAITTSDVYTVNLLMREDGLRIDRVVLTADTTFIPTGFGPAETERQLGAGDLIMPITRTIVYTYDNLYRLTAADYTSGENYQYSYDPVGNRLEQVINGDTSEYLYDAANRLAQLNGQAVYSFDNNGNLLNSDTLTNTFDAANRLVETQRDGNTVQPIYNGVNDRVGQTVGLSTTNYALDVAGGLPEVIYTSEGNLYLHLPGVIMAENAEGEVRYLLGDGLGSVRQGVDENAELVAYNEFDPYGNPVEGGGEPYGFTGEWWEDDVSLLHLRTRWYQPQDGIFLSRDPVESEPPYQYVRGNPINDTDPSGLYAWTGLAGKHGRIQRWFEANYGFWNSHFEFNIIPSMRPDILYFPRLAVPGLTPGATSPVDFSGVTGWQGEIYEIKPLIPLQGLAEGGLQLFRYYTGLSTAGWFGGLQGTIGYRDGRFKSTAPFNGQNWEFNTINWDLGITFPPGPHTVPMQGQGPLWVARPVPGLIVYVDQNRRDALKLTSFVAFLELARNALKDAPGVRVPNPRLNPAPACPILIVPEFFFDPQHPYNPLNPFNCLEHPEYCNSNGSYQS
jgi:RHS repeat-associated protein